MLQFVRRQGQVKIGGRKIGPLFFGGRLYSVGPLTAWAYWQIKTAAACYSQSDSLEVLDAIMLLPLSEAAPLAPLMTEEPIQESHLRRMTKTQLKALWTMAKGCTDFDFIQEKLSAKGGTGDGITISQAALGLCIGTGGAYSVKQLLFEMPYQEFLAILDDFDAIRKRQDEAHKDKRGLDEEPW